MRYCITRQDQLRRFGIKSGLRLFQSDLNTRKSAVRVLTTERYLAPKPLEATDLAVSDDFLAKALSQVVKVTTVYGIKTPAVNRPGN